MEHEKEKAKLPRSDFDRIFEANLRGNMRVPQLGIGIFAYTLQAIFSSKHPEDAAVEYLTKDLNKERLEYMSDYATRLHTAFKVGTRTGEKTMSPRVISAQSIAELWERQTSTLVYLLRGVTAFSQQKDVSSVSILDVGELRPYYPVIRACLDAAVETLEKNPEVLALLKDYRKGFSLLTFASDQTRPVIERSQRDYVKKIDAIVRASMQKAREGFKEPNPKVIDQIIFTLTHSV